MLAAAICWPNLIPAAAQPYEPRPHDWELVRSVSNPYGGTIDLVLIPEPKQRDRAYYSEIVDTICGIRTTCIVNFWTDRSHIPNSSSMPLGFMSAMYERSPSYAAPVLQLACWLYPSREAGKAANCMNAPGAMIPDANASPMDAHLQAVKESARQASKSRAGGEGWTMLLPTIALACVGICGIVAGIFALSAIAKLGTKGFVPERWRGFRAGAAIVGLVCAVASWPLTYWMGYPIQTPDGVGRVVGIPFFVAYFDFEGLDYVGPLTVPGAIANSVFWFLLPQLILLRWGRARQKRGD